MDPNAPTQVQDTPSALASPIVQAASTIPDPTPQVPARAKETGPGASSEVANFVEVVGADSLEKEPLPPEVSSWMEKVSRDTSGEMPPEIVIADTQAQSAPPMGKKPPVFVLPLGSDEYASAKHQGVQTSVRWLAEWCTRLVKKLGNQATFG